MNIDLQAKLLDMNVVDLPICIDACGNDMYIHISFILEHMANGGHKISAITLMGTSPEVILSKVE